MSRFKKIFACGMALIAIAVSLVLASVASAASPNKAGPIKYDSATTKCLALFASAKNVDAYTRATVVLDQAGMFDSVTKDAFPSTQLVGALCYTLYHSQVVNESVRAGCLMALADPTKGKALRETSTSLGLPLIQSCIRIIRDNRKISPF